MATWPVGLPLFSLAENWVQTLPQYWIASPVEEGPPKTRRNPNPKPGSVTFTQFMTRAQTVIADNFYIVDLDYGTDTFTETNPRTELVETYQLAEPPAYPHKSGNIYTVTWKLWVIP